jgi:hypothetical protein
MAEKLTGHLTVATCIGCGARNRAGECPGGCSDVALDLVDADDLQALTAATDAREIRIAALQKLALTLADRTAVGWKALQDRARAAMRPATPDAPDIEVIEAWGCPRCGRIDAPQPCLGICIRRPGTVADAREYRELAPRAERAAAADQALSGLARLILAVTPRPGREDATIAAVRARARHALDRMTVGAPAGSGAPEHAEDGTG